MEHIKRILKHYIRKIKRDPKLSLISVVLLTALFFGTFLVGFIKTTIILVIIALIVYVYTIRKNNWHKKYGNDPEKRRKRKKRKTIFLIASLVLAILLTIGVGIFCFYIVKNAPAFAEGKLYTQDTSVIYDSQGAVIAKLGTEKRQKITFDQLPQVLIDAVIATEDSRFFQHNGFDLPRFAKASIGQVTGKANAGGGSTITMQVVKNTLTSTNQNVVRKFTDIYLSVFVLEKKYTKEEIFELYVNIPYLGSNSYGVEEASQSYFGKSVSELTLSEAALIAGLFQSPSAYDPYNHSELATERRATVLYLMHLHGYITKAEEDLANSIPVKDLLVSDTAAAANENPYQAFIDTVVAEVEDKTGTDPYETPMEVYTTMIKAKQDALTNAIAKVTFKNDYVQTGVAMTDTKTGAIVAIYGGRNKNGERTYNYAVDIKKQIGSTAKPIYDYGPGMEYLNWNELTPFTDEVWTYSDGVGIKDWDGKYMGKMTLKRALGLSRNIPALKAFQTVSKQFGTKKILEFVQKLGMSPEIAGGAIYETHSVGAYVGESPLTMAAAYAAFGNGGYYNKPFSVNKIVYKNSGNEKIYKTTKTQAMSDATAFQITDCLLWSTNSGLGSNAKVSGIQIAAKSGTTNYDKDTMAKYRLPGSAINDLWMVAYSPSYSVAVWYGYDEISSLYYSNGSDNKLLLKAIFPAVFTEKGDTFVIPDSVVKMEVEVDSDPLSLPSPFTPADKKVSAWFKVGAEPTEISPKYNALGNVSGLTANIDNNTVTLTWDYNISDALASYLATHSTTVGTVGYNVYKRSDSGTLTLLGFTTDKTYTVNDITTSTTFVVKTTYSLDQTTVSSGTSTAVAPPSFDLSLNGGTLHFHLNQTFSDPNPLKVNDLNGNPIAEGNYTVINSYKNSANISVSPSDITKVSGTYTITYNVTYAGVTLSIARNVIVN